MKAMKGNCQIVNFGAGFDTLYWKLKDAGLPVKRFVEIDFANVTSHKCHYIKNNSKLMEALHCEGIFIYLHHVLYFSYYKLGICYLDEEVRYNTTELHSGIYHLAAADLRKLSEVESKLKECSLEFSVPTLFLFECVLVYMPIQFSHSLLQLIADKFSTTFCINYEQVCHSINAIQVYMEIAKSSICNPFRSIIILIIYIFIGQYD